LRDHKIGNDKNKAKHIIVMVKVVSPLFGVLQVRFLRAGRFKKGVTLVGRPAPWVIRGWRALRGRQFAVVGTLVRLASQWDNLSIEEKRKYGEFKEYVKAKFHEEYQRVLSDMGLAEVPKKVRIPKGAEHNNQLYQVIKSEAAAWKMKMGLTTVPATTR